MNHNKLNIQDIPHMCESSSELSPQSSSPSQSQTSSLHSVLLQTNSSERQATDPANKRLWL